MVDLIESHTIVFMSCTFVHLFVHVASIKSDIQGVPKKAESNFKVRLFKDDLIV